MEICDRLERGDSNLVVVARWRFYREQEGGRLCFIRRGDCESVNVEMYTAVFRAAMDQLSARLAELNAKGARVILVLDMPRAEHAEPEDLAFRRFSSQPLDDNAHTDDFPPTEALARAGRRAGVEIVNPAYRVCLSGVCPALTAEGRLLHSETGHLRSSAMRTVGYDLLDPFLLGRDVATAGTKNGR